MFSFRPAYHVSTIINKKQQHAKQVTLTSLSPFKSPVQVKQLMMLQSLCADSVTSHSYKEIRFKPVTENCVKFSVQMTIKNLI